ncbi:MAG: Pyridoxamine 5-phosphate oxidase [Polyangiaceae bacterium]|jgi:general stress protein 26|nr:Pyridoxamine 5-phosphate oxidase [Polyangiaceae bacterium]
MAQPLATPSNDSPEAVAHLVSLLRDFDAATLVTRSRGGSLHGRPMAVARVDDNVTLWFITSVGSAKVEEVAEDARSMVTLQSSSRFVCVNGNAELVFDPEQIRSVWRNDYQVWFQSERDPDIVLVRFTSFDAEYWDNSGAQGLKYVFQAARAYVSGQKLDESPELKNDLESHAKLRLWDAEPK